ncbi:MAG: phosphatidate cytidylyltransferase [Limnochordia bacterium]|jgi:dolichol kinase|nr:phosphatidate cytidylyltransferase [Limnochordia bacterium]
MGKSDVIAAVVLILYYLIGLLAIPTMLKAWTKLPSEVIRKLQHVIYSLSVFLLLRLFSSWYVSVLAAFLLVLVAYPALYLLEGTKVYKRYFMDRSERGGELRKQLLYVQLSFALLILFFWGVLGAKWQYIVVVAVMAWGLGDAAAALVGKFFGKRTIVHAWVEGAKTHEGTLAMLLGAFVAIFCSLLFFSDLSWYICLLISLVVAPVCAVVELCSKGGIDTLTIPLATAAMVFPLVALLTYLGW